MIEAFYVAYGVHFAVRCNSAAIMKRAGSRLPIGTRPTPKRKVQKTFLVLPAGKTAREAERLLASLEQDVEFFVASSARTRTFLHAGVVGWNGRAIVFPGRSMSGKTTLVQEFIKAGAVYYSDEFALVDRRGRVHPYARWIRVRRRADRRTLPVSPQSLGAAIGEAPLTVGLVVLASYRVDSRWQPRPLAGGKAILKVLRHSLSVRREPGLALQAAGRMVSQAAVIEGVRGEAREVVLWCLDRIGQS